LAKARRVKTTTRKVTKAIPKNPQPTSIPNPQSSVCGGRLRGVWLLLSIYCELKPRHRAPRCGRHLLARCSLLVWHDYFT
jgi:hypothetical protein